MLPFYIFTKDEQRLRQVNESFTKFTFSPVALILTVFFATFNLVTLPFAYLVAIAKKIQLLRSQYLYEKQNKSKMQRIESSDTLKDLLLFILLGIPILILGQIRDAYDFLKLTYRDDIKDFDSGG